MSSVSPEQYKTLPANRPKVGGQANRTETQHSNLFGGLNLNVASLSNFISDGINFLGQFRRRSSSVVPPTATTNDTPNSHPFAWDEPVSSSSSSTTSNYSLGAEELIELSRFPSLPSVDKDQIEGQGHDFVETSSFFPTWCDLCGELIWGLYDNGATFCSFCGYTCHNNCLSQIRLKCPVAKAVDDKDDDVVSSLPDVSSSYGSVCLPLDPSDITLVLDETVSTNVSPSSVLTSLSSAELSQCLAFYNERAPSCQQSVLDQESGEIDGYVRVRLNLTRPINVVNNKIMAAINSADVVHEVSNGTINTSMAEKLVAHRRPGLTSFYLPPNIERAFHVSSKTTTRDVIRSILTKFHIADSPHKYALYEKWVSEEAIYPPDILKEKSLTRPLMRRMRDSERPLEMALLSTHNGTMMKKAFVFQENDPGEICWDSFSLPELKNFLLILDREEAWYKKVIHEKYEFLAQHMQETLLFKNMNKNSQ